MRSLIVEDDPVSCKLMSHVLNPYGAYDIVYDGFSAIDAFTVALDSDQPYGLVCLDVMMPRVDGLSALMAMRELEARRGIVGDKRARIVMVTALAHTELVDKALKNGADAHMAKPLVWSAFTKLLGDLGIEPVDK